MTREERSIYNYWLIHREVNNLLEKICPSCEEWKNETENFYLKNKSKPEMGYFSECKICTRKRVLKWNNANLEKKRESCRKNGLTPNTRKYHKDFNHKQRDDGYGREYYGNNKERFKGYMIAYESNKAHKITAKEWVECKEFFNHQCAYCGTTEKEHKEKYKQQLHKEHAMNNGTNGIENCVPSCRACNSSKRDNDWIDWYVRDNPRYTIERHEKIAEWLSNFSTLINT